METCVSQARDESIIRRDESFVSGEAQHTDRSSDSKAGGHRLSPGIQVVYQQ
jgi:hypothetical protein